MPDSVQNNNTAYQPPVAGYSYSNSSQQKTSTKKPNIFFVLILEIFGLLFLLFIFLAVLNYFNIISLNSINPALFGFLPHMSSKTKQTNIPAQAASPVFLPQRNSWMANGTLHRYNETQIEIKVGGKIIKLEFSSAESIFYKSITTLDPKSGSSTTSVPDTLYGLEKNENIGKKVNVQYAKDAKGSNIIQIITLLN